MSTTNRPKPPIRCKPCRVEYQGTKYRIFQDGSVCVALSLPEAQQLGLPDLRAVLDYERDKLPRLPAHSAMARDIRREAARLRRNRNARERAQDRRDLGMKQTTYGWE